MYSFPTTSSEGHPQLDWYLEDGTIAAKSIQTDAPGNLNKEFWEHQQLNGEIIGKSLKVETGFGHYTPDGTLIEETENLAGFWGLCDIRSLVATPTAATKSADMSSQSPQAIKGKLDVVNFHAPDQMDEIHPQRLVLSPGLLSLTGLSSISILGAFAILLLPILNRPELPSRDQASQPSSSQRTQIRTAENIPPSPTNNPQKTITPARPQNTSASFAKPPLAIVTPPPTTPVPPSARASEPTEMPAPKSIDVTHTPATPQPGILAAQNFVLRLREAENRQDIPAILRAYAARVNFHSHGQVDHAFIEKDKQSYFQRWRVAEHQIDGSIRIDESPLSWKASYLSHFTLKNEDGRHVEGKTECFFTLTWEHGRYLVTEESAKVLESRVINPGRNTMPSDDTNIERVRQFVIELRHLENAQRLPEIMENYSDRVMYFKQGTIPASQVRMDKENYFRRWPVATQKIEGNIFVQDLGQGLYQANYESSFITKNSTGDKIMSGRCRCNFTLRWIDGALHVVQEGGEVLSKHENSATPAAKTPSRPAPPTLNRSRETFEEMTRRLNKL